MQRSELSRIFSDTCSLSRKFGGRYVQSTKYDPEEIPNWEEIMGKGEEGEEVRGSPPALEGGPSSNVEVVKSDTLTAALQLRKDYPTARILVLNMANETNPGGGVRAGCRAQEEQLFRCSNYMDCVNAKLYPIKPEEFIVTEGVTVFKDELFNVLAKPEKFDFIAMPALRNPLLLGTRTYRNREDHESMQRRIDLIVRYAVLERVDVLVLGALGCGAYGNPNVAVAKMFKASMDAYSSYFKKVVFAILSKGEDNYLLFKHVFSRKN